MEHEVAMKSKVKGVYIADCIRERHRKSPLLYHCQTLFCGELLERRLGRIIMVHNIHQSQC